MYVWLFFIFRKSGNFQGLPEACARLHVNFSEPFFWANYAILTTAWVVASSVVWRSRVFLRLAFEIIWMTQTVSYCYVFG